MKVVICALAKNEHKYINEWVKYHLNIGFDYIYLFDNDDNSSEYIGNFIENKEKVRIFDAREIKRDKRQHYFYNTFYQMFKDTFDYCLFIDIDEYLSGVPDVKKWLSTLNKNAPQIRIKWRLFGDDNLITRDLNVPVYLAFNKEITKSFNRDLKTIGNLERQAKFILKGHLNNAFINSPHFAGGNGSKLLPSILPNNKPCNSLIAIREDYSGINVFINHYMTKSLSEFIEQKVGRGDAVFGNISIDMSYYWRINEQTDEKLAYLKEKGIL